MALAENATRKECIEKIKPFLDDDEKNFQIINWLYTHVKTNFVIQQPSVPNHSSGGLSVIDDFGLGAGSQPNDPFGDDST